MRSARRASERNVHAQHRREEQKMCLGIPGRVQTIYDAGGARMGKVNFGGIVKDVCLEYVPELTVGDYTIVHVGFALTKIDEVSARETLKTFQEMGLLEEELKPEVMAAKEPELESCFVNIWITNGA
jgi:hydrogenase expression/formation protein HypC